MAVWINLIVMIGLYAYIFFLGALGLKKIETLVQI